VYVNIPVQVVEANKNLSSNIPDDWNRDASVLVTFDQRKEIVPENFKEHANVLSMRSCVIKGVQKSTATTLVTLIPVSDLS
jgi:hypothetical protein